MGFDPNKHRRTGRTTRMLRDALLAAEDSKGGGVFIIGATEQHCRILREQLVALADGDESVTSRIVISTPPRQGSIWLDGIVRGSRDRVFADHHAIEFHLGWALGQYRRYGGAPLTEEQ